MIDPHWYETPDYFYKSNTLFDSVPRGKYDIYVGEYVCNNGVGSGNMNATLSEAAFMMGMERNSDVVKMTSYAPLLTNVNAPNWHCNLIWFDRSRVAGRASYYLQSVVDRNLSGADSKAVPFTVESGKWYDVEIKVSPDMTSLKMDGKEVISWGGQEMPQQFFLADYDKNAGEDVIKAVNASSSSYPAEFNLAGASEVSRSGTITTLKSESLDDENSLDEPFKIAPETKSFDGFSSQFKYDLPPYSVVVMRVKVKLD